MPAPLSDAELHQILEHVSDVLIVQSFDSRIVYVTPSVTPMFGWQPAELLGVQGSTLWHADDLAQAEALRRLLEGTEVARGRGRMRCKDDSYRWVELTGQPIFDEFGHPRGVVSIVRDVELLVAAEQALVTSLEKYRLLAEYASDVVLQTDLGQRIRWASESVTRALGWRPEVLIGTDLGEILHPLDRQRVQDLHAQLAEPDVRPGTAVSFIARVHSLQGTYLAMTGVTTVVETKTDDARYAVTGLRDIHDLVEQKELTQASEALLRATVDSLQDPHVIFEPVRDGSGNITDFTYLQANPLACEVNGRAYDELVGTRLLELHPAVEPSGLLASFVAVMETGTPLRIDDVIYSDEMLGQDRHYDIRAVRVGRYLSQTWRDVTDRQRSAQALAEAEHRYRLISEHAADLVATLSEQGEVTWVSPSLTEITGWSSDDVIGHAVTEFLHPDDLRLEASGYPVIGEPRASSFEARLRDASGQYRWMSFTVRPFAGADDQQMGRVLAGRVIEAERTARLALAESEERFRLAMTNATIGMTLVSPEGQFMVVNPALCAMLGRDEPGLTSCTWQELTYPDDLAIDLGLVDDVLAGRRESYRLLKRYLRADGSLVWGDLSVSCVRNDDGSVRNFISQIVDVTEQVRAREQLEQAERRFRLLAENAMDLVVSLDLQGRIQWISPSVEPFIGYPPDSLADTQIADLLHPDDVQLLLHADAEAREGAPATCRMRMRTRDGRDRWVEAAPRGLHDDAHQLIGSVIGVRDIDVEVRAHEALQREVDFDALTGLAKRPLALARVQRILDARGGRGWALLCLGLHGMTAINQAYTYSAGDDVLRTVAQRLVLAAGGHDRVARIAGDEFLVLIEESQTPADAVIAATRLLESMHDPVQIKGTQVDVTASVGIAMANEHRANELMRDASAAMHLASAKGGGGWEFLDRNIGEETRRRLALQMSLREAIGKGRLQAWYMPIVSLQAHQVIGYEALVRWIEDDQRVRSPVEFLEVAERTGLIQGIDRLMLRQAVGVLADSPQMPRVGVNISAATLGAGALTDWIHGEFDSSGVDPSRLHLEVTETDLFQVTDQVRQAMRDIAALGISWWVDDFGTGFSSLSHLRDLPITGLKLDRSFTARLTAPDDSSARLARGLAGLAEGLDLRTIAEGVETAEQARILTEQGWQMGQGWLYGRAEPLADGAGR